MMDGEQDMSQRGKARRAATRDLKADRVRLRRVVDAYLAHVFTLREAIQLQWSRIDQGDFREAQLDMALATGVLRDLLDAGEGLRKLGLPVGQAVDRFLGSSGGVKNARDVLAHKADYLRGVGSLQLDAAEQARTMGAAIPDTTFTQYFVRDNAAGTAIVMSIGRDVSSPVGVALPEAIAFADRLLDAGHDWLEANPVVADVAGDLG